MTSEKGALKGLNSIATTNVRGGNMTKGWKIHAERGRSALPPNKVGLIRPPTTLCAALRAGRISLQRTPLVGFVPAPSLPPFLPALLRREQAGGRGWQVGGAGKNNRRSLFEWGLIRSKDWEVVGRFHLAAAHRQYRRVPFRCG